MRSRTSLALAALPGLLGCGGAQPPARTLHIATGSAGGQSCWVEAEGIRTSLDELPKRAHAWRGRQVIVDGGVEMSFGCFAGTISVLQKAGVKPGFVSEPPPPSGK
jgi:hypothetical protein